MRHKDPDLIEPYKFDPNDPADWRPVKGFEGRYECSRWGNVRTIIPGPLSVTGVRIKPPKTLSAYFHVNKRTGAKQYEVTMTDASGRRRAVKVARIIADAWMGGCPKGYCIFHRNGMITDNSVENLEFVIRSDLHKVQRSYAGSKVVVKEYEDGRCVYYRSSREAARNNPCSYQAVLDRCNGKVKNPYPYEDRHGKYQFHWDK